MSVSALTAILFGCLLIFLALGLPISFVMGGLGALFALILFGVGGLTMIPLNILNNMRTIILMAVPLFIFMGNMLEVSGIADGMYAMMYRWLGPVRGGLAIGTVLICTLFAACTGISGAATVTMGLIALPSMLKRGYDKKLALGCIAAGGALGVLIPPSVLMVIYAFLSLESVGRLFVGGILPGLMLSAMFMIYVGLRCFINPSMGPAMPAEENVSWKEKLVSLKAVLLPIVLILLVLGAIFSGFSTPTEAAAVGAVGAVLCAMINRHLNWKNLKTACYRTLNMTAMVMWIVIGAAIFTAVYTRVGGPAFVTQIIQSLPVNRWAVMIGIQVTFFILGCFMDPTGIMMVCTPVFVPVIKALGFDTVWFGVLFVVNMEMAYLTPPFGFNLFYLRGIAPEGITMNDIYKAIWPFVALQAVGLAICMAFPQIILLLPNMMFNK